MNSDSSPYFDVQYPDSLGGDILSIALIGPDDERRKAAASALAGCQGGDIREFTSYPPSLDDVPRLLEQHYDVIIIDLDSNPEYAFELVESICANGSATVMVYSLKTDPELLVRCMRAGAREFLTMPFAHNTMAEALVRASARRPATRPQKKTGGRLLGFLGAKGGDGVTTLACNFAVSLVQESGLNTLLIDLNLPLGDAALNLGIQAEYSTINALQNAARLDWNFLSKLLVKHSSGVSVLAAPGRFPSYDTTDEAVDRLLSVARQEFDYVVVDAGSRLDLMGTSLFKEGSTIYLVIQAGITGLRNSNRLISQYFTGSGPKLEIVLNRYDPRSLGVAEDQITKALTRPAGWKIPNDYNAVRRMQNTATPLALEDSPMSRIIHQMARTASGLPAIPEKKTGFSFLGKRGASKSSQNEDAPQQPITQLGLNSGDRTPQPRAEQPRPEAPAKAPEKAAYVAPPPPPAPEPQAPPPEPQERQERPAAKAAPAKASAPSQKREPETRVYKGQTYIKAPDGQWHLLDSQAGTLSRETPIVMWQPPAPICYGTVLSSAELNATASVEGTFEYSPAEGEVLAAGTHMLSATFTPEDTLAYNTAQAATSIIVTRATPTITWNTPAPIAFGTPLGNSQLNARSSVSGKFSYTPAAGEVLAAGMHTITATFTPNDTEAYTTAQAAVSFTVAKATPAIIWPTPAPIACGAELGAAQLNATASVPGRFTYTPGAGEVLSAGAHSLSVIFTPSDSEAYSTAQGFVSIKVTKVSPAVTWPTPAAISYGTALSSAQLNATASVPGTFAYNFVAGEVLAAGTHTLSVTFSPTDSGTYTTGQASVTLKVGKVSPNVDWSSPANISYGTALGPKQLNASASVPGKFVYSPAAGEMLAAGSHTLTVTFTPEDAADYNPVQSTVTITVGKATPTITWPTPAPISYGTALSSAQLNATSSVPGNFTYIPAAGAVPSAGTHTPSVIFTPKDSANYTAARAAVSLKVGKATPAVSWPTPAPIAYGTPLGANQLNATASVPGRFTYTPAAGEVLAAGTHTLTATFTPSDQTAYNPVQASVSATVTKAKATVVTWPAPAGITYGTALSAAQLNATASLPGRFAYTPASGAVLAAGTHTLTVTFTPTDGNFPPAQASVPLTVAKAIPTITWPAPAPISYGTTLGSAQLNATASVSGRFVYSPAAGDVLAAGTHKLSVTFNPTNTANDATAQASATLTVNKATPAITWPTPAAISYGTPLGAAQLNARALVPGSFVYTPGPGTVLTSGTQTLTVTFTPTNSADYATAQANVSLVVDELANILSLIPDMDFGESAAVEAQAELNDRRPSPSKSGITVNQQTGLETRVYKGATYVKGVDGQWHLQEK